MEIVVKFLVGLQSLLNQERSRTVTFVLISAYYSEDSMDFSSYYNVLANNHLWDTVFSLQVLEKVDYHLQFCSNPTFDTALGGVSF